MSQERPFETELETAVAHAPAQALPPAARSRAELWVREYGLEALALVWVLAFAFTLRTVNVNWDRNQHLHPDERFLSIVSSDIRIPGSVGEYFDSANSPLNPYNRSEGSTFVYGTFPLFLNKITAEWLDRDADGSTHQTADWLFNTLGVFGVGVDRPDGGRVFDGGYNSNLVGRVLSAIFDTLTVLIVYELGRFLYGRRAGLVAAGLLSVTVLHLQYSHFFGSETFVGFFATAVVYFSARIWKRGDWWDYAGAGVALGLAIACKLSVLPVLLVIALAVLMRIGPGLPPLYYRIVNAIDPRGVNSGEQVPWRGLILPSLGGFGSLLVAGFVFRIFQPYAFAGPGFFDVIDFGALAQGDILHLTHWVKFDERFVRDIDALRETQTGTDFPPNIQWIGRTPFVFPLVNMVVWGLGIFLSAAVALGVGRGTWRMVRDRDATSLLLIFWVAFLFLFIGRGFVPTMRYFIPIYPAMAVLGAAGIVWLWEWAETRPHIALPAWLPRRSDIRQRIPTAARVACVVLVAGSFFWGVAFVSGVYGRDISRIHATEWIAENVPAGSKLSNQVWDDGLPLSLPNSRINDFVPVQFSPYDFDNPEKVMELTKDLDETDYVIESSNRLYDSIPRIPAKYPSTVAYYEALFDGSLGFEKVAEFTNYPGLFGIDFPDQGAEEAFSVYDHPRVIIWKKTDAYSRENTLRILQPDRSEAAIAVSPGEAATNALQLRPDDYAKQQSGGTWSDVFNPDGWTSGAPWLWWLLWLELAAFAAVPWVTWLFRALPDRGYGLSKVLGFTAVVLPTWALVAWGFVDFSGTLSWTMFALAIAAGLSLAWRRRVALRTDLRERWPTFAVTEGLFLVAFFGFLALRAWNPDIWYHPTGGEKPMEVAYLTAVTRSTTLPPYDPWFGGGYMNYYYMGWFFLAVPIRALQVVPEVAFNLGVPTFASLAAVTAFSTVHNLVAFSSRATRRVTGVAMSTTLRPAIIAGVLGAALLVIAGNLDTLHQNIERFQAVNTWTTFSGTPVLGGAIGLLGGFKAWLLDDATLRPYDWWRSSRVHFGTNDITEFPYWTFLFADLHPHLMNLPFFGAIIALATGYVASVRAGLTRQAWLLAAALGLGVGLVRTIHTWDFPTVVLITVAGIAIGQLVRAAPGRVRALTGAAHLILAGGLAVVVFTPYTANSEVFNSGLMRAPETTEPQQFLAHFGIFIAFTVAFLVLRYSEERRYSNGNFIVSLFDGWFAVGGLAVFMAGLIVFTAPLGLTVVAVSAVALVLLVNLLVIEAARDRPDAGRLIATAALILGLGIAAGVDLVTVKDDIVRMNTVFKFSMQAWQLWAIGSAFAAWYVARALWQTDGWRPHAIHPATYPVTALGVLFLIFASMFVFSGTPARQSQRFATGIGPTLDGLAYLDSDPIYSETLGDDNAANDATLHLANDRPLVDWLRGNVEGSPTVVEAVGGLYHWTGRISVNTGLPSVIGWDWHQIQQRGQFASPIGIRRADTSGFYQTTDIAEAEKYLRKYDVSYVVLGETERAFSNPGGISKFDDIPALVEVFRDGDNVIYRVDKQALGSGAT